MLKTTANDTNSHQESPLYSLPLTHRKLIPKPLTPFEESKANKATLGDYFQLLDPKTPNSSRSNALLAPIPREAGILSLTIIRKNSGFNRLYPKYLLQFSGTGEFLLNAKKRAGNKLSNYLISSAEGEFDRKKPSFISKLRATEGKKKYLVFDSGENFFKNSSVARSKIRNEIG